MQTKWQHNKILGGGSLTACAVHHHRCVFVLSQEVGRHRRGCGISGRLVKVVLQQQSGVLRPQPLVRQLLLCKAGPPANSGGMAHSKAAACSLQPSAALYTALPQAWSPWAALRPGAASLLSPEFSHTHPPYAARPHSDQLPSPVKVALLCCLDGPVITLDINDVRAVSLKEAGSHLTALLSQSAACHSVLTSNGRAAPWKWPASHS